MPNNILPSSCKLTHTPVEERGLSPKVSESVHTGSLLTVPEPSTLPDVVANISAKSRPADSIPLFVDDTDIDSVVIWPLELKFPDTVNFSLPVPILI